MASKILYHGSIHSFSDVNVQCGKGYKDFGKGFYTSGTREHAVRLAKRNRSIELDRLKRIGKQGVSVPVYLYTYEFDTDLLKTLKVLRFKEADLSWAKFVVGNRQCSTKTHNYDVVIGPTADDGTKQVFKAYNAGAYGSVGSEKALKLLTQLLETGNLSLQYFFGTPQATSILRLKGKVEIL